MKTSLWYGQHSMVFHTEYGDGLLSQHSWVIIHRSLLVHLPHARHCARLRDEVKTRTDSLSSKGSCGHWAVIASVACGGGLELCQGWVFKGYLAASSKATFWLHSVFWLGSSPIQHCALSNLRDTSIFSSPHRHGGSLDKVSPPQVTLGSCYQFPETIPPPFAQSS